MKVPVKYILPSGILFLLLILLEWNTPRPIDWRPTFSMADKIPYGSYLVFELLPEIFPDQEIQVINKPFYEASQDLPVDACNYIFINDEISPDKVETERLLTFVAEGNYVFIAANAIKGPLADTLHLTVDVRFVPVFDSVGFAITDSIPLNFSNPALASREDYQYRHHHQAVNFLITSFDTLNTTILGTTASDMVNFIRIRYGEGAIFYSTVPLAFTNYNVLYGNNYEYIAKALSYLPVQTTYWDEYYKVGRTRASSPLRYILSQPALKRAYIMMITGFLLFLIFEGRRRQRIIPLIPPLRNTTVEFVQTISRLYLQSNNHKKLAEKKILHFLEFLRSRFYIKTNEFSEAFYQLLVQKSGVPLQDIQRLFFLIQQIRQQPAIDERQLLQLHKQIEQFYRLAGKS